MQRFLLVLNDACYGIERSYNALRLATALSRKEDTEVRVFLMGDAVTCGKRGQKTPQGSYNIEQMLHSMVQRGAVAGTWGTCLDTHGLGEDELAQGVRRSSLAELAEWTQWADKVLVF